MAAPTPSDTMDPGWQAAVAYLAAPQRLTEAVQFPCDTTATHDGTSHKRSSRKS